ncbi:exodeoxyribonuclease V subunit alpha [Acinetobacter piscicola]|uniref:exodeoxyribonuclease V subunit alpha n=1 Tax=Acinetobacter piscicola TaxID=2006115 RepID=UPI000B7D9B19|nr:exodeoxyribonuclease V subunit alpha [Acinetobacter piscicola]
MENKQDLDTHTPQWIATWSQYLLQQFSTDQQQIDQAKLLIEEVLEANLQGDSCIAQHDQNIQSLGHLALSEELAQKQVVPFVYDAQYLYLYRYWKLEQRLATQVLRLQQQQIQPIDIAPFDDLLTDHHQKAALNNVANHAFNIITGGPGTGKTYTLARIIAVLHHAIPNIRIAMAAPTGKAAQRMGEALQKSLLDPKLQKFGLRLEQFNPITIHRLLGLGNQQLPRFNQRQPLPYDVIVIDEASMLDLNLATLLFEAVPDHCRLILLGDANQLASVDVGSVLADLQQVPTLQDNRSHLLTSQRFKGDALIGKMAQFIQSQKQADLEQSTLLNDFENQVVQASVLKPIVLQQDMQDMIQLEYLPEDILQADLASYYQKLSWGFQSYFQSLKEYLNAENSNDYIDVVTQAFDQYRILTAVRHGMFGLNILNLEMEKALFEAIPSLYRQGDWYVGRPVMMTYNDYQLGLSNGDIGICFKHRQQPKQFEVFFPSLNKWISATRLPKVIQTAFVLTIHKSQGSEFTHTAVVLDPAATKLLSQELIYTAITRAKSVVSLLVDQNAFRQSLSIATIRMSGLVNKINKNN